MAEIHSEPHTKMHVVPKTTTEEHPLVALEAKIHDAVKAIGALQEERSALQQELQDTKALLSNATLEQGKTSSQAQAMGTLMQERDRLIQERQVTARRVEAMLERLKSIGIQ